MFWIANLFMSTLAFIISSIPSSQNTATAVEIIHTAIEQGKEVLGVFFYQNGVLNAAAQLAIPNDEYQTLTQWQQLAEKGIALHLCITAAEKRGLSDEVENSISTSFNISGLGELVTLTSQAERVIQL